jgi:hypothetical protein
MLSIHQRRRNLCPEEKSKALVMLELLFILFVSNRRMKPKRKRDSNDRWEPTHELSRDTVREQDIDSPLFRVTNVQLPHSSRAIASGGRHRWKTCFSCRFWPPPLMTNILAKALSRVPHGHDASVHHLHLLLHPGVKFSPFDMKICGEL